MRYSLLSLIVLLLLASLGLEAQTDVSIRRSEFKTGKSGFSEAWKHVGDGDSYYAEKGIWYANAFDEYLKALVYNNSNPELNYKTGVAALFSDKKEEAAGFFQKAIEVKTDVAADILFLNGRALQFAGRYQEAIDNFNKYLSSAGKKAKENLPVAKRYIEECKSALIVTKDTLRVSIENAGPNVNSASDDYSEILTRDGKTMYFASRKEIAGSGSRHDDTKFDENIFVTGKKSSDWDQAVQAGKNITSPFCETPLYINGAGDRLYIYAGYENGGDIKVSVNKKGQWKSPGPLPYKLNTKGSETSFCFSPLENEIYFVTDKGKDSFGGKDIYFMKKLTDRKWSRPQNAGGKINTAFDEEAVRLSSTGDTLWFSSKGHNSIGGFDIFFSVRNKLGEWDSAKNYGYPVNTSWDDMFYLPSPSEDSSFYFVSNRSGGLGGLDIYHGRILPPEKIVPVVKPAPPKRDTIIIRDTVVIVKTAPVVPVAAPEPVKEFVLYLQGKVTDSDTRGAVMAKIDVIDKGTNEIVATTASSDIDGSYKVRLPAKKTYMIDLRATGFLSDVRRIDVPDNWPKDVYNLNIDLIKVKVGKKVVLNNILFESGKAILTPGSYNELDRLLGIMQENAQIKIEISGHTDKTGSEAVNLKLSEDRAKSVVGYLIQKGIDKSRMESKGYGSVQPISDNATPQGRAKNRRVEFKILEF